MALEDQAEVADVDGVQDRWWWVGPASALTLLSTLGAFEVLVLLLNLGVLASIAAGVIPDDCPPGVTCSGDLNLFPALPQQLIPLAILSLGWLLAILSFRGPTTIGRRPRRWTLSVIAAACPVVVWVWLFV